MTKDEVIKILGSPVSVSAKDDAEYLNYNFSESETKKSHEITAPYFVRLINGKVESYGRL